jgi:type I restriction enzyme S subunit
MAHDVKAVEDHLALGPGNLVTTGTDVGRPHVQADRLDLLPALLREGVEVGAKACLLAVLANVFDRRFDSEGLAFISEEQAAGLAGVVLEPRDLLLNITGDGITFSRACLVPTEVFPACVNQHVAIIRMDKAVADPRYVLSYLTHPSVKRYVESFNAGGSRRAITKGHIESFELPLPSLSEQRAIGDVLSAFDDKIELNQRMNQTLEAMARALFKSWFVDFDPVRAKAEGRDPGLPKHLADLFPACFVGSELGEIPEGWVVGRLGDVADCYAPFKVLVNWSGGAGA